jgi:hypothetical protein
VLPYSHQAKYLDNANVSHQQHATKMISLVASYRSGVYGDNGAPLPDVSVSAAVRPSISFCLSALSEEKTEFSMSMNLTVSELTIILCLFRSPWRIWRWCNFCEQSDMQSNRLDLQRAHIFLHTKSL